MGDFLKIIVYKWAAVIVCENIFYLVLLQNMS